MPGNPPSRNRQSASQPPPGSRTLSMTSTITPAANRTRSFTQSSMSRRDSNTTTMPSQTPPPPPPPQQTLRPKRSRTASLFHLFSKPNVERAPVHSEPLPPMPLDMPDIPRTREPPPERPSTRMSLRSRTASRQSLSRDPSPPLQRPSSRLSLRRLSTSRPSQPKGSARNGQVRADASWDPPPLFQAYPQAIKHLSLRVPGPSHGPNNQPGIASTTNKQRHSIFGGRSKSTSQKPASKDGTNIAREGWSKKIYVLVTSGYVLEYAGDGPFDRLPEQILRLGRDSAAFASDLIPGFPYVLQVLQTATGGVQVVQLPQKSFLSRIGLQLPNSRRMMSSLLMVFDEPEQMDSWMVAIRKEIESLGGKKCRPISTVEKRADASDPQSISSQRYQVFQRAPSRSSMRAESMKSVPSLSTLPTSPTYVSQDRTDSANFTGVDNQYSTPYERQPNSTPYERPPNSTPYERQPTDNLQSNVRDSLNSSDNNNIAHTEQPTVQTAVLNRISAPPPRIPSQDFSQFYFTDAEPEDLSMVHPANRPQSLRFTSFEHSSRRTSGTASQPNLSIDMSNRSSQWQMPQDTDNRTLQLLEQRPSSTAQEYRSSSLTANTPRFPLGPRVYSQSTTSLNSPTGTVKPSVEQASTDQLSNVPSDSIGLGIDSYSSANTDSTQDSGTSDLTETSSITSKRDSYGLSPFILSQSLQQSPTIPAQLTSQSYGPRISVRAAPPPLRIPSRQSRHQEPSSADSPYLGRNSPSPAPSIALRRPASLPVNTDRAPFLSSVAKVKGVRDPQRTSVLVPIVRPGSVRSSRAQRAASMLSPPMPPPSSPLPNPPGIAV